MPHVVRGRAVVLQRVIAVQVVVALARRLAPADAVIADVVAERLAVGVGGKELQAVGRPLPQARLQGVIGADADRVGAAGDADRRVEGIERPALVERRPRADGSGAGQGLVEVERHNHV